MNNQSVCLICLDIPQNPIEFKCQDIFCSQCLTIYYKERMSSKQLIQDDFKCLKCNIPIDNDLIKQLGDQIYHEFCQYSINNNCIQGLQNEIMVDCFNCPYKFIIDKRAQIQKCSQCNYTYCRKCFNIYKKGCCLQPSLGCCPKCKIQIYKDEGCNFIRCKSQSCKGQTYFCCICFRLLPKDNHYSHFIDDNPYQDCKYKNIKPNLRKCPKCNTYDPAKCQIINNVAVCNSYVCIGTKYCLDCGYKYIEPHKCSKCNIF
ncbi:hypothetical protein pb186bvf_010437 [Paramecium bursaria]